MSSTSSLSSLFACFSALRLGFRQVATEDVATTERASAATLPEGRGGAGLFGGTLRAASSFVRFNGGGRVEN